MTAEEVRRLVLGQIGNALDETNLHGTRVHESLVEPRLVEMVYPGPEGSSGVEPNRVWLVLQEGPDGSGYKIIYDEELAMFGLATPGANDGHPVVVSSYQNFMDAFNGM